MNLFIYGTGTKIITDLAKKIGFNIVKKNPSLIASFGGDGTFMLAEKEYPNVPKFYLKNSRVCKKCFQFSNEDVLKKVLSKKYIIEEYIKISAKAKDKNICGLNEIIVHNKDPRRAIRYEIFINNKKIGGEIIGDGVVVASPYGSTGYYRAITASYFEVGIGVAFNNSTEQSDHIVIKDSSKIKIKITRGVAVAYADNHSDEIELERGDEIFIEKSLETAKIIKI
ncbi:MAG: hypothetical protein WCC74_01540 [Minisyncoccia bacterium]